MYVLMHHPMNVIHDFVQELISKIAGTPPLPIGPAHAYGYIGTHNCSPDAAGTERENNLEVYHPPAKKNP